MRGPAALADERDLPAGAADTVVRQGRCGRPGEPPAGERGRRLGERVIPGPAPAPEHQRRRAALLGGELEPARRGHRHPPDLADHRREAAMAHPLLDHREHLIVAPAFGVNETIRGQPRLRQAGREQIAPRERPEHLPAFPARHREAGGERGEKQGRGGLVIGRGRGRCRLVQPAGESAARQSFVHLRNAEGETRPRPGPGRAGPFDRAHLRPQGGEARIQGTGSLHATRTRLFALCSDAFPTESSLVAAALAPAAPWR